MAGGGSRGGRGAQVGDPGIGAKPQGACEGVNSKGFFRELRPTVRRTAKGGSCIPNCSRVFVVC